MNNEEKEYHEAMKEAYYCVPCGAMNPEDCCCDESLSLFMDYDLDYF